VSERFFLETGLDGAQYSMTLEDDGSKTITMSCDVSAALDYNKALRNHNDGYTPSRDMVRVASIPASVRWHWMATEGWDCADKACRDKLMQKLDDPEWQHLRTGGGRMGKRKRMI
jgi:hypothetical protein